MAENMNIACPHCGTTNRFPSEKLHEKPKCGRCKEELFAGKPIDITRYNFQQHINSGAPVVIDFWAPWCGPCRSFAPVFEQAAAELEPEIRLGKVNTEDEQSVAAHFGIRSIPTLIIFKDGKELARQSGAVDRNSFMRWVQSTLQQGG